MSKIQGYIKEIEKSYLRILTEPQKFKNLNKGFFIGLVSISIYYSILTIIGFFSIHISRLDLILIIKTLIISVFISFAEEIIFRDYLFNKLLSKYNSIISIIITSYIYSQAHFLKFNLSFFEIIIPIINLFLFGIILSNLYIKKGIYNIIGLHWSFIFFISYLNQTWIISPKNSSYFITGNLYPPNGILTTIIFVLYLIFDFFINKKESN